jgi:hypothetical protein
MLAVAKPPPSIAAWSRGAMGERLVAAQLSRAARHGRVIVLNDRRIPGSRANIDHIVVGPLGIYVVDTKRYTPSKIERRSTGGILWGRPARLFVGGRDKTWGVLCRV